jgi:DNA-binding NarL/FixJ family response regulator
MTGDLRWWWESPGELTADLRIASLPPPQADRSHPDHRLVILPPRVVILSSFDDWVLRQAAADAGAYAHVVKDSSAEPILEP